MRSTAETKSFFRTLPFPLSSMNRKTSVMLRCLSSILVSTRLVSYLTQSSSFAEVDVGGQFVLLEKSTGATFFNFYSCSPARTQLVPQLVFLSLRPSMGKHFMNSTIVETFAESAIFYLMPSFSISVSIQSHIFATISSSQRKCLNTLFIVSLNAARGTQLTGPWSFEMKQDLSWETNLISMSIKLKQRIKSTNLSYIYLSVLAMFLINLAIPLADAPTSWTPAIDNFTLRLSEIPSMFDAVSFAVGLFFLIKPSQLLKSCNYSRLVSFTGLETLEPAWDTWSAALALRETVGAAFPQFTSAISLFISPYLSSNSARLMRDKCETALPGKREFQACRALPPEDFCATVHFSSFKTAESRSILIECRASLKLILLALEKLFFSLVFSFSSRSTPCSYRIVKNASSLTTPLFSVYKQKVISKIVRGD